MLLREYDKQTGKIRNTTTRVGVVVCDTCGCEFERSMSRLVQQDKHACSLKCVNTGRQHTESWKRNMSERMRGEGNHFFGAQHDETTRVEIGQRVSEHFASLTECERKQRMNRDVSGVKNPFFGKRHTLVSRISMSETRSRLIVEGKVSSGPRGWKGTYTSSKTGRIERYDSFYELIRMKIHDANDDVIDWTKLHGIRIGYTWKDKPRIYVPDFLITQNDQRIIEEIKGYEDASKLEAKLAALIEFCNKHAYVYSYLDRVSLEQCVRMKYDCSISTLRKQEKR